MLSVSLVNKVNAGFAVESSGYQSTAFVILLMCKKLICFDKFRNAEIHVMVVEIHCVRCSALAIKEDIDGYGLIELPFN